MSQDRVRIIVELDLGDEHIPTTLTVQPPIPLMNVAENLRLLATGIETGQILSVQLPKA